MATRRKKTPIFDALNVHLAVRSGQRFEHYPKVSLDADKDDDLRELVNIATSADERLAAIGADSDLSPKGKDKAAFAARKSARAKSLAWGEKMTTGLDANIESQRASIQRAAMTPESSDPIDRLRLDLQRQEIRKRLGELGLEPTFAGLLYGGAPLDVQDALRSAPAYISKNEAGTLEYSPLVDPAIIEQHAVAVAEQADPEAFERIEELEYLRDTYRVLAKAIVGGAFNGAPPGQLEQAKAEEQGVAEEAAA